MLEVEKEEFMERKLVEKEEVGIGQIHHTLVVPEERPASQAIADQKLLELNGKAKKKEKLGSFEVGQ